MRKIIWAFLLLLPIATAAQNISISGRITDTGGEPLVGVSIAVKGTTLGTLSAPNGEYAIQASPNATLVFSLLGMAAKEEAVGGRTRIDIVLTEIAQAIDEVVVVGYGTVKKANLTGATDQLKSTAIESRPVTSVAQALQGTLANLNVSVTTGADADGGGAPGAKMNFNIRGVTGLDGAGGTASASPLFVIDGIQGGDINSISGDDIETITVLKDAASSAIYGSNAPYGVVLITTKKGKKGKPVVTYNANVGWSSPINLPTMMGSVEWMETYNEAYRNRHDVNSDFFGAEAMQRIRDFAAGKITTSTVVSPVSTRNGRWAAYSDNPGDNDYGNDNIDWFKVYYKDWAFNQQHNLGVSGGGDNISYYMGLGYVHKDGLYTYGNDSYDRYNFRANLSSNISSWLTANVRTSLMRGVTDTPAGASKDAVYVGGYAHDIPREWAIVPLRNPDGRFSASSGLLAMTEGGRNTTTDNLATLTGELVVNPLKGWDITFNYSYSGSYLDNENNVLKITSYDAAGNPYAVRNPQESDALYRTNERYQQQTLNLFTSYERDFGDHYLKALLGFAQEDYSSYQLLSSSGSGTLYVPEVPSFGAIYENNPSIGEERSSFASRGVFGRVNYGYKERYLVEINGRYDGTSRFLKDVRFKVYPGVSAAWVASRETFWKDALSFFVETFKLRVSYGSLGDQGFLDRNYYPFYPSLTASAATSTSWLFNGSRYNTLSYPALINSALTWVTSTTVDFGFDLGMFSNRLTASYDWYQRSSDDLVGPAEQLPAVLGSTAPPTNNAALTTTGMEVTLGWRDRIGDIAYGVRATLADAKSVVRKYPNKDKSIDSWYDGATVGDIWGYETEGYYTAAAAAAADPINHPQKEIYATWTAGDIKYKDQNNDGFITQGNRTLSNHGDLQIIGNSTPRYSYGLTLDAEWRGLDLRLFLQGVGEQDAWMSEVNNYFWGIIPASNSQFQSSLFTLHRDRWTPDNPDGYYPKFYLGTEGSKNLQPQTKYLQDASYLRLKNVQLGYTLPKAWMERVNISKLRVYVSGENLLTLSSMPESIDPEFAVTRAAKVYPLSLTLSCGLNLIF